MSDETDLEQLAEKELMVLRAVKSVITSVIKDTSTEPGMKHPLSDSTIEDIRQCLALITAREHELAPMTHRPRFIDEPEDKVVVSLTTPGKDKS